MIRVWNAEGKSVKDGKELDIIPGMTVEVGVLTGRRIVLQYITKPFHRMRFTALRERYRGRGGRSETRLTSLRYHRLCEKWFSRVRQCQLA